MYLSRRGEVKDMHPIQVSERALLFNYSAVNTTCDEIRTIQTPMYNLQMSTSLLYLRKLNGLVPGVFSVPSSEQGKKR